MNDKLHYIKEKVKSELAIANKKVECPQTLAELNANEFWKGAQVAMQIVLTIIEESECDE